LGNSAGTATINEINPLAPVIAPLSNATIHAEMTLSFYVSATNLDHDPMVFSLAPGAPPAAAIGSTNGFFSWTTADTNVGVYTISVKATDTSNGLSGTQSFTVTVVHRPAITSIQFAGNHVNLTWTAIPGDSYLLQSTTNLTAAWTNEPGTVHATNTLATKGDFINSVSSRYYRIAVLQ